jgi:hypothetical protein
MLRALLRSNFFRQKTLTELSEAKKALQEVHVLHSQGELKKALLTLDEIEKKYPSSIKTTSFYRGKIGVEFLDKLAATDQSVTSATSASPKK